MTSMSGRQVIHKQVTQVDHQHQTQTLGRQFQACEPANLGLSDDHGGASPLCIELGHYKYMHI